MEWLFRKDTPMVIDPLFLKAGFVLSVSVSGYIFSKIRSHQTASSAAARRRRLSFGSGGNGRKVCGGLKEELVFIKHEEEEKVYAKFVGRRGNITRISRRASDEDGYMLPEFHRLLEDFKLSKKKPTPTTVVSMPVENKEALDSMKREIVDLRNLVRSLQEKEKILKVELVEYRSVLDPESSSVGKNWQRQVSDRAWEVAELESTKELKLKELKDEAMELRKENSRLAQANLDLMKKMESNEISGLVGEVANLKWAKTRLRRRLSMYEELEADNLTDDENISKELSTKMEDCNNYKSTLSPKKISTSSSSGSSSNKVKFLTMLKKLVPRKDTQSSRRFSFCSSSPTGAALANKTDHNTNSNLKRRASFDTSIFMGHVMNSQNERSMSDLGSSSALKRFFSSSDQSLQAPPNVHRKPGSFKQ